MTVSQVWVKKQPNHSLILCLTLMITPSTNTCFGIGSRRYVSRKRTAQQVVHYRRNNTSIMYWLNPKSLIWIYYNKTGHRPKKSAYTQTVSKEASLTSFSKSFHLDLIHIFLGSMKTWTSIFCLNPTIQMDSVIAVPWMDLLPKRLQAFSLTKYYYRPYPSNLH